MINSPYATKFTREQQAGIKNPSIDMTNRKAAQRPSRIAAAQARAAQSSN